MGGWAIAFLGGILHGGTVKKKVSTPKKQNQQPDSDASDSAVKTLGYDPVEAWCKMHARLLMALREQAGLSHEELAALACISPSTVRTVEAAGPRAAFTDGVRLCMALGFDLMTLYFELDRRLDAEGTPFLPGRKSRSAAAFVKTRCEPPAGITPAEVRRQLRVLGGLTLAAAPGPPARKRKKE